jgi:hypothetical protein
MRACNVELVFVDCAATDLYGGSSGLMRSWERESEELKDLTVELVS